MEKTNDNNHANTVIPNICKHSANQNVINKVPGIILYLKLIFIL